MISESNLGHTFPTSQFITDIYIEPFRIDHTRNSGDILLMLRRIALQAHC